MATNVETVHCKVTDLFGSDTVSERNSKLKIFLPAIIPPKNVKQVEKVTIATLATFKGSVYKYSIEWRENSLDTSKKWDQKYRIYEGTSSTSPLPTILSIRKTLSKTGVISCDGPCQSKVAAATVVQFGCDHLICLNCRISQKAAPLFDGSPGCCNAECLTIAKFNGEKIRSGNLTRTGSNISLRGPYESINVHVSIVKRLHNNVVRNHMEYEFSSQNHFSSLRKTLFYYKDILAESRVYYSLQKPECREDLNLISLLDTNLRFYDLTAASNTTELYFVIIGKERQGRLHFFQNKYMIFWFVLPFFAGSFWGYLIIPSFLMYLPVGSLCILPVLLGLSMPQLPTIVTTTYAMYPAIDTLPIIIIVDSYRNFVLRPFLVALHRPAHQITPDSS